MDNRRNDHDQSLDPQRIVEEGYNRIAEQYSAWTGKALQGPRARYTSLPAERLSHGAEVLELGCATGVPTTRELVKHFSVTGVDISARNIQLAKQQVPEAKFEKADITQLVFPPARFDAVTAFYTITHVPREAHAKLLQNIASWLRPGGLFIASMGAAGDPGSVEENWLGVPMYFSAFDSSTNKRLVDEAGLQIVSADEVTEDEDGTPVTFLWVVAKKPDNEVPERIDSSS